VEGDVWDKVLGLGTTDALTGDVATWSGAIVTTMWAPLAGEDRPNDLGARPGGAT